MVRIDSIINGIVYKATSPSGKSYIGITQQTLQTRKLEHLRRSKSGSTKAFHNAIRKYGEENIKWEVIDKVDTWEKLEEIEMLYIQKFDTYRNGYNMTLGGDGTIGYKYSEEQVEANRKRRKEYFKNPKNIEKQSKANLLAHQRNPNQAKEHSKFQKKRFEDEKEREKVAEGMRKYLSEEERLRIHSIERGAKPFQVYKDGELIGEWLTQNQCARDLGVNVSHLNHCLHGKRKQHKGYKFKYKED
jgi:group I intron endonuclease